MLNTWTVVCAKPSRATSYIASTSIKCKKRKMPGRDSFVNVEVKIMTSVALC
jgi:hypothetical protein